MKRANPGNSALSSSISFPSCSAGERNVGHASPAVRRVGSVALSRASLPTIAACVRRFCLDCLGASSARGAFDCQSRICPLYQASPFRHTGRHRVTKGLVVDYCRHCQPGDQTDCGGEECALFPWRPWQPGGQPKLRTLTEPQKRRLRLIGQASQFRNPRQ